MVATSAVVTSTFCPNRVAQNDHGAGAWLKREHPAVDGRGASPRAMKILPALAAALLALVLSCRPGRRRDPRHDLRRRAVRRRDAGCARRRPLSFLGRRRTPGHRGRSREVTVSRRTRSRGDSRQDCNWVTAAALKELAMLARKTGDDLIVDVRSNWKHNAGMTPGHYTAPWRLRGRRRAEGPWWARAPQRVPRAEPPRSRPSPQRRRRWWPGHRRAGASHVRGRRGQSPGWRKVIANPDVNPNWSAWHSA
jgi:hypothetical protein